MGIFMEAFRWGRYMINHIYKYRIAKSEQLFQTLSNKIRKQRHIQRMH